MIWNRYIGGSCLNAVYYEDVYFCTENIYTYSDPRDKCSRSKGFRVVRGGVLNGKNN